MNDSIHVEVQIVDVRIVSFDFLLDIEFDSRDTFRAIIEGFEVDLVWITFFLAKLFIKML
jgi:hypothetical protein